VKTKAVTLARRQPKREPTGARARPHRHNVLIFAFGALALAPVRNAR
jgi:hypothetical protein